MRLSLLIIALLSGSLSQAQQHFFLYIQTENKQPFYIKTNEKVYSSSATGYVVISKLSPDIHVLTVGFNKDAFPQQDFRLIVDKDAGYLLKNYGSKGWGLVNLQNNQVVMNGTQKAPDNEPDEDAFSKTLSQVVNTPDLKNEIKKTDTVVINKSMNAKTNEKPDVKSGSSIRILLNEKGAVGRQMVYVDDKDTVRIFIENNLLMQKNDPIITAQETIIEPKKEVVKEVKKTTEAEVKQIPVIEGKTEIKMINSDCKLLALQEDFLKLRKKMAAESRDDEMINAAKKQFKTKCFATEQIRNLSVLFLTDEGKYKFLDASYPYVHDSSNFGSLENILNDNYYKNRFQAMIRH